MSEEVDFFVSYTNSDEVWAKWIAWELEKLGLRVTFQRDFLPGSSFVSEMEKALGSAKKTMAILSPAYLASEFARAEWTAAFCKSPTGDTRPLVPVRVVDCSLPELLRSIVHIDLVGKEEAEARAKLVNYLKSEGLLPERRPPFPGVVRLASDPSPREKLAAPAAVPQLGRLAKEMERRYRREAVRPKFVIVSDRAGAETEVFRETAKVLLAEIDSRTKSDSAIPYVVVGVSGGRAHKFVVDQIALLPPAGSYSTLVFVALNAAAISARYSYTANYLVTRLSEIFAGSHHLVCLPNATPSQFKDYADRVAQVDLILGGAGGRDGFLKEWLRGFTPQLYLPEGAVGDFCYTPIGEDGDVIAKTSDSSLGGALARLHAYPSFANIDQANVILPLVGQPQMSDPDAITSKGQIGHTVLRYASVGSCILTESAAMDILATQLSGHILREKLQSDGEGIRWKATRVCDRKDVIVRIVRHHRAPESPATFQDDADLEIIIADPPDDFNPSQVKVVIGLDAPAFHVGAGVRRPGHWSTAAVRTARRLLQGRVRLEVLDLGCGCGVVGCLLAKELLKSIKRVTLADISADAVRCAKENTSRFFPKGGPPFEFQVSNLFSAIAGKYDVIVFSPPYLPAVVDTQLKEADGGGEFGLDVALPFARDVHNFLKPGGLCLMPMANYVKYSTVEKELINTGLQTKIQSRTILYPYEPGRGYPPPYEVLSRTQLEEQFNFEFRDEIWGERTDTRKKYLSFEMVQVLGWAPTHPSISTDRRRQ